MITSVVVCGTVVLRHLMMPPEFLHSTIIQGACIAAIMAAPISYFVGLKMMDINILAEKLEYAVNHDNLTGACSRMNFHQRLESVEDQDMVLIMADVDHFKRINDRYGHKAGDHALKQFVTTLVRNCREDDVVARFGGEEFVILLKGVSRDEGEGTAQRLCECVRGKRIFADGQELQLTASFGVAEIMTVSQIDIALQMADLAVYRAKREGRDQVCVYDRTLDGEVVDARSAA
ncbi:GGDEF domain-containing protein [Roseovarius sp. CAU 1744]|uniref:GGDEF domain-containing protein n=1 Tax=Roseovarius sp. CAU 1744 TaxID=3140368 RepID=UPI00325A84D0